MPTNIHSLKNVSRLESQILNLEYFESEAEMKRLGLKKDEKESDIIFLGSDRMNNQQAIGYMIMATRALGIDDGLTDYIVSKMIRVMDEKTEEEAEKVYKSF